MAVARVQGHGARAAFGGEAGGHRWQGVSPTESRGRVHTSTVTVAVLPVPDDDEEPLEERDLDWKTCRGSGAGGQHRNVTDSAVTVTHRPTGITVRCESERSQHQNRDAARAVLRSRLAARRRRRAAADRNANRRRQLGSGMRGDKIRTIAMQRDQVVDHRSGRRVSAKRYLRGFVEEVAPRDSQPDS